MQHRSTALAEQEWHEPRKPRSSRQKKVRSRDHQLQKKKFEVEIINSRRRYDRDIMPVMEYSESQQTLKTPCYELKWRRSSTNVVGQARHGQPIQEIDITTGQNTQRWSSRIISSPGSRCLQTMRGAQDVTGSSWNRT